MEQWIMEYQKNINNLQNKCMTRGESALASYSLYMLRFINGLMQMESSQFYTYQKKVLWSPMRVFSGYFIEQVEAACTCTDIEKKEMIIDDIENAVCKIAHVYRNVVDATSNADRQMFTCLSVDTNMYELSPKLFAYYSDILETLVALYKKKDVYAFLLHPSFKSNIETINLFCEREKPGKVVLIYIPEKRIEEIKEIPVYLMHESYHVLGKEERCRKFRAVNLNFHIKLWIKQMLFRHVQFFEDSFLDDQVKEKLCECWFTLDDILQYLDGHEEDDRIFYSKRISNYLYEAWTQKLINIFSSIAYNLSVVLAQCPVDPMAEEDSYGKLILIESRIRSNILNALSGMKMALFIERLLYLYRESFADMACILTLGLKPDEYENAFEHSISFSHKKEITGLMRNIRSLIVAKVIAKYEKMDYYELWDCYCKKKEDELIKNSLNNRSVNSEISQQQENEWMPDITVQDLEFFDKYLTICSKQLMESFEQNGNVEKFRDIINRANMIDILSGRTSEALKKLYCEKENQN